MVIEKNGYKQKVIWRLFKCLGIFTIKMTNLSVIFSLGLFFVLNVIPLQVMAQELISSEKFSQRLTEIEQLKDSNLTLAYEQLTQYKEQLATFALEQQIQYYKILSDMYVEQVQYQAGKSAASKGLTLTRKLSTPSLLIADLLYVRGFALESLGDINGAEQDYLNGLDVAQSLHDNVKISTGLINLGAIYYLTERYERSLIFLNDAYKIANKTEDEELKGSVNSELGILYAHLRQEEQSIAFYQQSYLHFKNAGKALSAQNTLRNIGAYHMGKKQYEDAIDIFKTIITESDVISNKEIMYSVYSGLAWSNLKKNKPDPQAAYQYLLIAGLYIDDMEQYNGQLSYLIDKSFILEELGRYDEALDSLSAADDIFKTKTNFTYLDKQLYINVINLKANIYHALGQFKLAYELKTETLKLIISQHETANIRAVEEVRLRFESEQADVHNKLLENKKAIQSIALSEAKKANEQQRFYLIISVIAALIFAWLLVKLVNGQKKLRQATRIDSLTGIVNRKRIMQQGLKDFIQAKHKQEELSVLMVDVDHFKKINDLYGHQLGDKVLTQIAQLGVSLMRKTDLLGRFGGEEFIAFLPRTSLEQAITIAERFRSIIEKNAWKEMPDLKVTISIGVASLQNTQVNELGELIKQADNLLYQAKHQNRNKVCG